jgi:hypothetical protein
MSLAEMMVVCGNDWDRDSSKREEVTVMGDRPATPSRVSEAWLENERQVADTNSAMGLKAGRRVQIVKMISL